MLLIKSQNKADVDAAQRAYWWGKTPQQRLAAAARLIAEARQTYAANPANPVRTYGERILKSTKPIPRRER